jgi:arginase family enzyme
MNLTQYFEAYVPAVSHDASRNEGLNSYIDFYDEHFDQDVTTYDIYIVGVQEGRLSLKNETCAFAPDEIRNSLYELCQGDWSLKVLDLGNLKLGHKVEDTYVVLEEIVSNLILEDKIVLVLGGGHDLISPIYKGHCAAGNPLNFASADAYLDFQDGDDYHSRSFLSKLLASQESLLSKYTLMGYQTYLCAPKEVSLLEQMDFNLLRLGDVNGNVKEMEPYLRDVDHLSVDASVVKSAELPANVYASPNGLSAEILCAIMRYAGMSHQLKSVLLSELNPRLDKNNQSSKVYAQAIWYFIEGFHLRKDDFPDEKLKNFKRFHVSSDLSELLFYKSMASERWWVELPMNNVDVKRALLPCSFLDYKKAVAGILSERLLKLVRF